MFNDVRSYETDFRSVQDTHWNTARPPGRSLPRKLKFCLGPFTEADCPRVARRVSTAPCWPTKYFSFE